MGLVENARKQFRKRRQNGKIAFSTVIERHGPGILLGRPPCVSAVLVTRARCCPPSSRLGGYRDTTMARHVALLTSSSLSIVHNYRQIVKYPAYRSLSDKAWCVKNVFINTSTTTTTSSSNSNFISGGFGSGESYETVAQ